MTMRSVSSFLVSFCSLLLCTTAFAQVSQLPDPPSVSSLGINLKRVIRGEQFRVVGTSARLLDALGRETNLQVVYAGRQISGTFPTTMEGGRYILETTGPATRTPITLLEADEGNLMTVLIPLSGAHMTSADVARLKQGYVHLGMEVKHVTQMTGKIGGACDSLLLTVDVGKNSLSQVLAEYDQAQLGWIADVATSWHVDQELLWDKSPSKDVLSVVVDNNFPYATAGSGVTIAILDTPANIGASTQLTGRVLPGRSFLDLYDINDLPSPSQNHSVLVAERIAGKTDGLARAASILPIITCNSSGSCNASDVVQGVCWSLTQRAPQHLIINLSLGGATPNTLVAAVLKEALQQGAAVVASNRGKYADHFPAAESLPGLISVSAAKRYPEGWVRLGSEATPPDLVSPGATGTENVGGSSFAAALVSGAVAHWRSICPNLSPVQLENEIKRAARFDLLFPADQIVSGAGLLFVPAHPVCP